MKKTPRTGLALGSGSARGLAHIGVIRALNEAGIDVHYVAGSSMGAVIGAVYASGMLDPLEQVYLDFDWKKITALFDVILPKSGLIDGKKVSNFVRQYISVERIEALPIPFRATATDINSGEEIIIDSGDVIEAVRASISVPGIFTPVKWDGRFLVDGGLVNPVPVSVVRAMGAEQVIAVDLNHGLGAKEAEAVQIQHDEGKWERLKSHMSELGGERYRQWMEHISSSLRSYDNKALRQWRAWQDDEPLPSIFEVMLSSINIMETQITRARLQIDPPDILIQPPLGGIRFLDYNRAEEIIATGYETACGTLTAHGYTIPGV